ncbi:DeoR/GlpR family DNA-binding transcription regulator [Flavobacterium sp. NPDC079362]|uniref:DeoR/GlpR family DNA-binding transcription regulator n=1 Tax=Flavobacterium sp. NPDC079362 TaxID=3390566 RepID=UPI003D043724
MLKEERFAKILETLSKDGRVHFDALAILLEVSEDTIRRDIEALHNNGLLSKVRGGAIPVIKNPLSFVDRAAYVTGKKEVIALKAQQFIEDGQTIFMDGGTTNCSIAAKLPIKSKLTIITNNTSLIPVLENHKNIKLILLGGLYNTQTHTTEGAKACNEISTYIADSYFLGTCAIDSTFGVTATFPGDADVKTAMHKFAKKTLALAVEEKLNTSETFRICSMDEVAVLITELPSTDSKLNSYRNSGIKIV